jgi:peroxiredoxin
VHFKLTEDFFLYKPTFFSGIFIFEEKDMAKITLQGNPVNTYGELPPAGTMAPDFARSYGVGIPDGFFEGLYARPLVVVDETGRAVHSQLVPEIATEPDYDAALAAL